MAKWKVYNTAKLKLGQAIVDLSSHTFKMALFEAASNANTLTHDELADLTSQVANGSGYTTGGVTLTGVTWTNSSGTITFDFDFASWIGVTGGFLCQYAVVYDDTVSGDPLICVTNLGSITVGTDEELKIENSASGAFTLSGATTD